ncbi:hydroxyacid oxidase 1-like [Ixodes scapularis]
MWRIDDPRAQWCWPSGVLRRRQSCPLGAGSVQQGIQKKMDKPRAVRFPGIETREQLVPGAGSSTGDGPQKATHTVPLSTWRSGEGAGTRLQRSVGESGKPGKPVYPFSLGSWVVSLLPPPPPRMSGVDQFPPRRLRLRPRVLRNVAERRIEVTLLGDQKLSMPVGISPTAFQKLAHPDGEIAVAKAAQAARTLMTLSSFSNDCLEDVQRGAPGGLRWFQLFLFMDREFTRNLVERAERSGYRAIVLTVDMPVRKTPDFAKMSNFCIPEHLRSKPSLIS